MKKKSVLVTGGAGYIGSVLVPELLKSGHNVTVLDNFYYRQNSLLDVTYHENLKIVRGDCRDAKILKDCMDSVDVIIPLAALVGFPLCEFDKIAAETTNYKAIETLVQIRKREQMIIYPCTNSGYGIGEKDKLCTEESPLNPISVYGKTKVDAEKLVKDSNNSVTLRLATVFGSSPRMRTDLLVNDFVYRAVNDRTVVVFEGHFKRNFIHIRDVVRAFIHVMNNFEVMKNETYNVGLSNANLSKVELCELIKKEIPQFVAIESQIGSDPDKRDYIVSNEKIEMTGYFPNYSIQYGIRELIKAYQIVKNNQYSNI